MRLIDADEFKKYVSKGYEQSKDLLQTDKYRNLAGAITQGILKDIDEQPTAYDVDKVVEKLKERASQSCSVLFAAGIEEAISIIKAGEQE